MKENSKKKDRIMLIFGSTVVVLICIILILIFVTQFPNGLISGGLVAIVGSVLGVILTVAVTAILLDKQSEKQAELAEKQNKMQAELQQQLFEQQSAKQISLAERESELQLKLQQQLLAQQSKAEQEKDKNVKYFEKKQQVYHEFLEKLKEIIQDGKIKIATRKDDGSIDSSVDELKDLIFQLGYLQMHATNEETIDKILNGVKNIIQQMNKFKESDDKQSVYADFYSSLSDELFTIVNCLKADLYSGKENKSIPKEKMNNILEECNLFIETEELDDKAMHEYFWRELGRQLRDLEYSVVDQDILGKLEEYYRLSIFRRDNAYDGLLVDVPIHSRQVNLKFSASMFKSPWYGFEQNKNETFDNELLQKWVKEIAPNEENECLFTQEEINFFNRGGLFDELKKDTQKRKQYIRRTAKRVDETLKRFIKIAEKEEDNL